MAFKVCVVFFLGFCSGFQGFAVVYQAVGVVC